MYLWNSRDPMSSSNVGSSNYSLIFSNLYIHDQNSKYIYVYIILHLISIVIYGKPTKKRKIGDIPTKDSRWPNNNNNKFNH